MVPPGHGGGGGEHGEVGPNPVRLDFCYGRQSQIPYSLTPNECQIFLLPIKFRTQGTIPDVKIPTLIEIPWVAPLPTLRETIDKCITQKPKVCIHNLQL